MSGRGLTSIGRSARGKRLLGRLSSSDRTLIAGTIGTGALNVATTALNFALTFTLARILGADGFGAYAYAFAWASLLAVPAVLGLTPLVVRNVAAYDERAQWGLLRGLLTRANQAVLLSSALLVVVGGGAALLVNGSNHELLDPVLVALLLVPLVALTSIRQAAMQGFGRVVLGRTPETLVAPVLLLVLVGAAYLLADSLSATSVVALQVAALLVAFVVGAFLLRRILPPQVRTERPAYAMKEWIRSALPLLVFSGVQAVYAQIAVILLGAIEGSTEAGLYSVSARVAGLVTFVMLAVGYPLSPMIARLHAAGQTDQLRRTVRRTAIGVFLASLPLALGVLFFARPLLALFGGEFEGGVTPLVLLALGQLLFAATGLAGMVLVMTGNESYLVRGVAAGAVAMVSLNVVLIPAYGATGAAVAALVGSIAMNGCLVFYSRRRSGVASTAFGV